MSNWAIVVGINQYPTRTRLNELNGAVADACDFADWALDPAGGNVPVERLFFWSHPWPDPTQWPEGTLDHLKDHLEGQRSDWYSPSGTTFTAPADTSRAPTASEIVRTAERAGDEVRAQKFDNAAAEPARIYVFLAGHGLRTSVLGDNSIQTCFVAGDFAAEDTTLAVGLVPCESLRRSLRKERFDEVLMFLDCCRTDSSTLTLAATPLSDLRDDPQSPGWSVGHAAKDGARAYETDNPPARGAFTKTLMDGLRGFRDPNSQTLTVQALEYFVLSNIGRSTTMVQRPYFDFLPKDVPLVVVIGNPTVDLLIPPGPLLNLAELAAGASLQLLDSDDATVWQGGPYAAGSASVQLPPLPPGLYSLRVVGSVNKEILFRQPKEREIHVI